MAEATVHILVARFHGEVLSLLPLTKQTHLQGSSRPGSRSGSTLSAGNQPAKRSRQSRTGPAFIEELLAEQGTLTAVARFAGKHDEQRLPAQARYYHDLIPLTKPRPGEQYAFTVNLDKCSGCKACVTACHSLNGLDSGEMWRTVGLLISEAGISEGRPIHQHVTASCHHCLEPGCADGCPVLAYEKDPITGIVRHLDDQCIGCRYCIMKCPYDVPQYSASKGIVRKCDMCHERLSAGEAPACVQACPHEAIEITIVNQRSIRARFEREQSSHGGAVNAFLPGSPPPNITWPTTDYTSKVFPVPVRSADAGVTGGDPAHWPLVCMLVITQLAAGLHVLQGSLFAAGWKEPLPWLARLALGALVIGLAASIPHLGRPLKAWRAFLGWRRSWMSREIIFFSIYAILSGVLAWSPVNPVIAEITAMVALLAVGCSAMVYVDTKRPAWAAAPVFTRFFGTVLLLGATAGGAWASWVVPALASVLATIATLIRTMLFAWEGITFVRGKNPVLSRLRRVQMARVILFVVSTKFSVLAIFDFGHQRALWAAAAFLSTISAQVLERYTFFRASSALRMPRAVL